ncbi:MAG: hypothetical protein AAFN92_19465, partial [Bacteroidota bacterium]
MPDEQLLDRARRLERMAEWEKVVLLEELSARRLDLGAVDKLSSPPLSRAKYLVRAKVPGSWHLLFVPLGLWLIVPLVTPFIGVLGGTVYLLLILFFVCLFCYSLASRSRILIAIYDDHLRYLPYGGENTRPPSTFTLKKQHPHHFERLDYADLTKAYHHEHTGDFIFLVTKSGEKIFAQCRKDGWTARWAASCINRFAEGQKPGAIRHVL